MHIQRCHLTARALAEPEKQYALVDKHVRRLREVDMLKNSPVVVMVERNLGFEVRARGCGW